MQAALRRSESLPSWFVPAAGLRQQGVDLDPEARSFLLALGEPGQFRRIAEPGQSRRGLSEYRAEAPACPGARIAPTTPRSQLLVDPFKTPG